MASQKTTFDYASVDPEQWLHMYEQMVKIRAFEENANELYTERQNARPDPSLHRRRGRCRGRLRGAAPG